jgi:hypothetical protein
VGQQRGEPAVTIAKACVAEPAIAMAPATVVVVVVTPLMSWA